MFAIARIFIGVAAGCFITTMYSLLSEFTLTQWRVWVIGFPSWPIEASIFALIAWLVQDWRHLQLLIAIIGIPCLLPWLIIPESFRWYIAHDKLEQAKQIVQKIAACNKREVPDINMIMAEQPATDKGRKTYSFLDLFRTRYLVRISLLSAINWFGLGIVTNGITFGIQALSGNIYMNVFLFHAVGIPSDALAMWLQNTFGRRSTTMLCYMLVVIGGIAVGVIEGLDVPNKDSMINGFAFVANMGINTAWGPIQTMTIELYPTVIRPIGFGTLSVVARIGAIIGSQLAYLNLRTPGLMYYVLGAVGLCCIVGSLGIPETKDASLNDMIDTDTVSPQDVSQSETLKDNTIERNGASSTAV